jgi:hypothetical protein
MNKNEAERKLAAVLAEHGNHPCNFFNILHASENINMDFDTQNKEWEFVKNESWHNLDLARYYLWSITDNGDLLWWNGSQTIAMNPRRGEYHSIPVNPGQFLYLVKSGERFGLFPDGLAE